MINNNVSNILMSRNKHFLFPYVYVYACVRGMQVYEVGMHVYAYACASVCNVFIE